jgi:hypothetical protein
MATAEKSPRPPLQGGVFLSSFSKGSLEYQKCYPDREPCLIKYKKNPYHVIPAKAGIQSLVAYGTDGETTPTAPIGSTATDILPSFSVQSFWGTYSHTIPTFRANFLFQRLPDRQFLIRLNRFHLDNTSIAQLK